MSLQIQEPLNNIISDDEHIIDTNTDINLAIIKERHDALRKISEDMEHINDISLSLKELVYEQAEPLEVAEQHTENANINVEQATIHIAQAETYANKFKNIFAKGALVSTGVTGAGAATGIFLNPIAGGIGVVLGVGGIVYCIIQMTM